MAKAYKHDVGICINKIIKQMEKDDDTIKDVVFSLSSVQRWAIKSNKKRTAQGIVVYRTNKHGKSIGKKSFLPHKFCPFCGKEF